MKTKPSPNGRRLNSKASQDSNEMNQRQTKLSNDPLRMPMVQQKSTMAHYVEPETTKNKIRPHLRRVQGTQKLYRDTEYFFTKSKHNIKNTSTTQ